jgi:hypothetical protein
MRGRAYLTPPGPPAETAAQAGLASALPPPWMFMTALSESALLMPGQVTDMLI